MKVLHTQWVMNTHPALLVRKGVSTSVALPQRVQQCLRLLQIRRIKPLGEPMVHGCKEVMGFLAFALLVPESSEASSGTEFPGFRRLVLGDADGMLEAGFGFSLIVRRLLQQEFAFEAVEFGFIPAFSWCVDKCQGFHEYRQSCLWLL